METISACPHHGFDTWMLVNHLYGGMSPTKCGRKSQLNFFFFWFLF